MIYRPIPPCNYTSPGSGLPAPDPLPAAAKPHWFRRKRKRPNPKDPWLFVFSGDTWRAPCARDFYRVILYHKYNMDMCRVNHCRKRGDLGLMKIESPYRLAAPDFKSLVIREGLRPDHRPNKERTGQFMRLWGWPPGLVRD